MAAMVAERLRAWRPIQKRPNDLPSKVLYYRDGVSEAQCIEVRQTEVEAIRAAYRILQPGKKNPIVPNITALVVIKRHHTRIYPKNLDPKVSCSAGTIVDSGITNPVYFDFFLQSHYPLAGTAKPTYYFVLENGMRFSARDLQDFTNALCSTYVRATLPVSYAPPAYYADRLCERARIYMKEFYDGGVPCRAGMMLIAIWRRKRGVRSGMRRWGIGRRRLGGSGGRDMGIMMGMRRGRGNPSSMIACSGCEVER
jgi:hypothetical protein